MIRLVELKAKFALWGPVWVKITFKDSKEVKGIGNYVLKSNLYLYLFT